MNEKQEILLRYFRESHSQRKISRDLGLSRKTIKRYVAPYESKLKELNRDVTEELVDDLTCKPSYNSSNRVKSKLTPEIISKVKDLLGKNRERRLSGQGKQQYKKIDIYEHLKSQGYTLAYSTICKAVGELEQESRETFIRQRYAPGEICEFDWGEVKIDTGNGVEKYQMAVFTSGYSNYRYSYLFKSQDTSSFQQAHVLFFEKINGVFKILVYDNMKVAVKRFVGPSEKEATDGLLKMSTYYNFSFRFCNVRRGNEKGHVERSVEYVRRKAFAFKDSFSSLEEANEYLETVCDKLNNKPRKEFEGKSHLDFFEEEKSYLFSTKPSFDCSEVLSLKVDKYSTVSFKTARYSVPDNLVGKMVVARIYPSKISFSYDDKKLCEHKRLTGSFEWSIKIEHYLKTLKRKPGALSGSEALYQMTSGLKEVYRKNFQNSAKDFIELIEYISEKQMPITKLKSLILYINPKDYEGNLLDKIKTIYDRDDENSKIETTSKITSEIDEICTLQLCEHAQLIPDFDNFNNEMAVII